MAWGNASIFLDQLHDFDAAYPRPLKRLEARSDSEFETLLRQYGLADVVADVKQTRRSQARDIRQAILPSQGRAPRLRTMPKQRENAIKPAILSALKAVTRASD